MIAIILLSFFIPLYHPEYLLGFVLGMTFTFGAILPLGIRIIRSRTEKSVTNNAWQIGHKVLNLMAWVYLPSPPIP